MTNKMMIVFDKQKIHFFDYQYQYLETLALSNRFHFEATFYQAWLDLKTKRNLKNVSFLWSYAFLAIFERAKTLASLETFLQNWSAAAQKEKLHLSFTFINPFLLCWKSSPFKDLILSAQKSLSLYIDQSFHFSFFAWNEHLLNLQVFKVPACQNDKEKEQISFEQGLNLQLRLYPKHRFLNKKQPHLSTTESFESWISDLAFFLSIFLLAHKIENLLFFGNLINQEKWWAQDLINKMKTINKNFKSPNLYFCQQILSN